MTGSENAREVVVVSGVRTGIGDYGGSLKDLSATRLGAIAIREAVARAGVDPASVGHVVMGSVIHGEARDMYLSRVAALDAGIPVGTPCLTVNRLCGSGLQSIVSAAQHLMLGDCDVAVAGGAESMSRAAYFLPAGRWGQRGKGQNDQHRAPTRGHTIPFLPAAIVSAVTVPPFSRRPGTHFPPAKACGKAPGLLCRL